ncbi:MAG: acetyl-CoA carboxylase biotin carboxylase subunit [Tunicatimonas sp.]
MKPLKKLLVANRGEIALRIMRSAREMGLSTVAVYSEADRQALHTRYADEAVDIGPAPSAKSYLNIDCILEAAHATHADAIHPGYGFLSENAAFAQRVQEAGLIFVGPGPEAIRTMGSKLAAKAAVANFNVPLVPGTDAAVATVSEALAAADRIGYPVLIKASAGGGGKGMRIVETEAELPEQMERAVSEAQSAFGDGSVFIEKFIVGPKHIEIQLLGDQQGNHVYLFERECSIQRRYQKVIEETPSPSVTADTRRAMGEAAVQVAKACNYVGAGTVEFVMGQNQQFYFLEMNTRLQVEHPVTEMITGLDLVKEQLRIAAGEPLSVRQEDLRIHGHALELRVYAEDPANNFLPDIGTLTTYRRPQGPGVRVDDGFEEGMEVPIHYDPMIAKLVVHAGDRDGAIQRMVRAIDEYQISGVATTLTFGRFVLLHPEFTSGRFTTKFVEDYFTAEALAPPLLEAEKQVAVLLATHLAPKTASVIAPQNNSPSRWKKQRGFK